jgi:hypothetical protein
MLTALIYGDSSNEIQSFKKSTAQRIGIVSTMFLLWVFAKYVMETHAKAQKSEITASCQL